MERLAKLAEQTTPVFTDLGIAAPAINKAFTAPAGVLQQLDKVLQEPRQDRQESRAGARRGRSRCSTRLGPLGAAAKPFAGNVVELLTSLRDTGGLERIMDFIFLGAGSANGYDALGHFLRAEGLGTACLTYAIAPASGCSAKLSTHDGLERQGELGREPQHDEPRDGRARSRSSKAPRPPRRSPATRLGAGRGRARRTCGALNGAGSTPSRSAARARGTTYYTPSAEASGAGGMLLNYLLGN